MLCHRSRLFGVKVTGMQKELVSIILTNPAEYVDCQNTVRLVMGLLYTTLSAPCRDCRFFHKSLKAYVTFYNLSKNYFLFVKPKIDVFSTLLCEKREEILSSFVSDFTRRRNLLLCVFG